MAKKAATNMNKAQFARLYFIKKGKMYSTAKEREAADKLFRHQLEQNQLDKGIVEETIVEYLREQEAALRAWLLPAKDS